MEQHNICLFILYAKPDADFHSGWAASLYVVIEEVSSFHVVLYLLLGHRDVFIQLKQACQTRSLRAACILYLVLVSL